MLNAQQFARSIRIDADRLQVLIDRGWISPLVIDGRPMFQAADLTRAALIADLADDMGVNDEGIDLVLDLIDQLYSLRSAFSNLIDALEVQPGRTRRHVANDARKLALLTRHRSHGLR